MRAASTSSSFIVLAATLLAPAMSPGRSPAALSAQEGDLVDRVAAVVGDSVIVLSQINERLLQLQYQGVEVPSPGSEERRRLQRDLLDQMIGEMLIVQAAIRDTTIVIDEAEVENSVSADLQNRAQQFGGQTAFQQALGPLERASELNPEDGRAPANLGKCLRRMNRVREAVEAFQMSLQRDPTIEDSYVAMSEAQVAMVELQPVGMLFAQEGQRNAS